MKREGFTRFNLRTLELDEAEQNTPYLAGKLASWGL